MDLINFTEQYSKLYRSTELYMHGSYQIKILLRQPSDSNSTAEKQVKLLIAKRDYLPLEVIP